MSYDPDKRLSRASSVCHHLYRTNSDNFPMGPMVLHHFILQEFSLQTICKWCLHICRHSGLLFTNLQIVCASRALSPFWCHITTERAEQSKEGTAASALVFLLQQHKLFHPFCAEHLHHLAAPVCEPFHHLARAALREQSRARTHGCHARNLQNCSSTMKSQHAWCLAPFAWHLVLLQEPSNTAWQSIGSQEWAIFCFSAS